MIFNRLYSTVFCLLSLVAFLAFATTGRLDVVSTVIFPVMLWMTMRRPSKTTQVRPLKTIQSGSLQIVIPLSLFALDMVFLSRNVMMAVVHVVLCLILLKLNLSHKVGDTISLFFLTFGLILMTTTITFDLLFLFFACCYGLIGIIGLMLLDMRTVANTAQDQHSTVPNGGMAHSDWMPGLSVIQLPLRHLILLCLFIVLLTGIVAVPIFTVMPRIALGVGGSGASNFSTKLTGFSENNRLGEFLSLMDNPTIVMQIETDPPPEILPHDLRWRGVAHNYFDGRNWETTADHSRHVPVPISRQQPLTMPVDVAPGIRQTIYLEATATRSLFGIHRILSVRVPGMGVVSNQDHTCFGLLASPESVIKYEAFSQIPQRSPLFASFTASNEYPRSCLQIVSTSPRVQELVTRITRKMKSTGEKVEAIHRYLSSQCRYSLNVAACPADRDLVEYFLFDTRKGHCEYFATAEAIMLRYAGVPTRLVNGFTRGEINPLTNSLVVRQRHAHAWVDFYDPQFGWLEDDPTPPRTDTESFSASQWVSRLSETIEYFWISRVVNYEASDQIRIFRRIRTQMTHWRNTMSRWFQGRGMRDVFNGAADWLKSRKIQKYYADRGWFPQFGFIAPILGILLLLLLLRHRRIKIEKNRPDRISLEYARFLEKAARAGIHRSRYETPWEFSKRLEGVFPPDEVQSITELFCFLRYAPPPLPDPFIDGVDTISRKISALKQLPRKERRRALICGRKNTPRDGKSVENVHNL